MDLQLLVAINVMAVSAMVIGMTLIYHQTAANLGWLLANAIVIAVGLLALWLTPDHAGSWVAVPFIPLIVAPALLARLQNRAALFGRTAEAARYARWVAILHPTEGNKISAALTTAIAASRDTDTRPLQDLIARVPTQYRPIIASQEALARRDWQGVLAQSDNAQDAPAVMRPFQIRAVGELGRRVDMVRAYLNAHSVLSGVAFSSVRLCVLAFGGRPDGTQALLGTVLSGLPEETKTFWLALATLNSDGDTAPGRQALATLAATAALPVTRIAAQRHLTMAAARSPEPFPGETLQALRILEAQTIAQAQARGQSYLTVPLTLSLIALNVLAFGAEIISGGSEDTRTLIKLGALTPPPVLEDGEWWRLVTASFLHFGPIHLATNMFVLWLLGRMLEPLLGLARMLAIYAIGGIASSAFVLWLMVAQDTDYGMLVGASGAIFALLGAEAGMLLADWRRERGRFDSRKLTTLAMMLGLQVVIDMSLPNVSFAAHASGFVTGVAVMLAWPYGAALFNAAITSTGRRS